MSRNSCMTTEACRPKELFAHTLENRAPEGLLPCVDGMSTRQTVRYSIQAHIIQQIQMQRGRHEDIISLERLSPDSAQSMVSVQRSKIVVGTIRKTMSRNKLLLSMRVTRRLFQRFGLASRRTKAIEKESQSKRHAGSSYPLCKRLTGQVTEQHQRAGTNFAQKERRHHVLSSILKFCGSRPCAESTSIAVQSPQAVQCIAEQSSAVHSSEVQSPEAVQGTAEQCSA